MDLNEGMDWEMPLKGFLNSLLLLLLLPPLLLLLLRLLLTLRSHFFVW